MNEENNNNKKYLDEEGLKYFLEKFKYAMAHNDSNTDENQEKQTTD